MKSGKLLKKEINFAMRDFYDPERIGSMFLLGKDDNDLIQRINNDDLSALWQFTFKHSNLWLRIIRTEGLSAELLYRTADTYFSSFIDKVKAFANRYKGRDLSDNWEKELRRTFESELAKVVDGISKDFTRAWHELKLTDWHVEFLNKLNDFLTLVEKEIVERAIREVPEWEKKVKDTGNTTSDYVYFVDICYLIKNSDGNPVVTSYHPFHIEQYDSDEGSWGLLCDGEDWRESGWLPKLNNRCCFLMHDLVYHSFIGQLVFEIEDIWVDTKIWDQALFTFSGMKWENRPF